METKPKRGAGEKLRKISSRQVLRSRRRRLLCAKRGRHAAQHEYG
jgi:hypothetical protein